MPGSYIDCLSIFRTIRCYSSDKERALLAFICFLSIRKSVRGNRTILTQTEPFSYIQLKLLFWSYLTPILSFCTEKQVMNPNKYAMPLPAGSQTPSFQSNSATLIRYIMGCHWTYRVKSVLDISRRRRW